MLSLYPIGVIRTGVQVKFHTRHQPEGRTDVRNVIELTGGKDLEVALRDVDGFSHIWLIWWFDRNSTWRPAVMPPRGPATKRGVFATRSPHRPNPIGMTAVQLLAIEGRRVVVGDVDLLDGTPILDIKPYLSNIDSIPEASLGWLEVVEEEHALPPPFVVAFSELAEKQLTWLRERWNLDFRARAVEILSRNPAVHRTRRIRRIDDETFEFGCGTWRLYFRVDGRHVAVDSVGSGYPERLVMGERSEYVLEQDAHIDFMTTWGSRMPQ